jgi:hypothetical protein
MTQFHKGKFYFAYSSHKTREAAEYALEDYFNTGEICEAEAPYVVRHFGRWYVMFPAE